MTCILFILVFFSTAVCAEEDLAPEYLYNECIENAKESSDYVQCNTAAHSYWDSVLQKNYADRLAECSKKQNPDACRRTLETSHRLWMQYRDAMVESIRLLGDSSSLTDVSVSSFLAEETKKQAVLLTDEEEPVPAQAPAP